MRVGTAKQMPMAQVGKWKVLRSLGAKTGSPKVKMIKLKNWQIVPNTRRLYLKRANTPTSLAPLFSIEESVISSRSFVDWSRSGVKFFAIKGVMAKSKIAGYEERKSY